MNPDWHAQMKPAILDPHCFSKLSNQDQHGKGQFINTLLDALFAVYCWQTARTQMKCCMVRNFITVCTVCRDKGRYID